MNVQRTPAGRSRAKSYTQLRGSAQRPVPFSAQSIVNGSTSRGSPNGTIGFAKRAVTWRTPLTSPRGLKNSTDWASVPEAVENMSKNKSGTQHCHAVPDDAPPIGATRQLEHFRRPRPWHSRGRAAANRVDPQASGGGIVHLFL